MMRSGQIGLVFGVLCVCALGCTGTDGGGSESAATLAEEGAYPSAELFQSHYSYMLPQDPEFRRMAPNYHKLRPVRKDTAIVITTASSESDDPASWTGEQDRFNVKIIEGHDLRFIVADSTGNGIIVWEFPQVPAGEYTALDQVYPTELRDAIEGHRWVYTYWLADQRFRRRDTFMVSAAGHLTPFVGDREL